MKKFLFTFFITLTAIGINVKAFSQSLKEIRNYSLSYFFSGESEASLSQSVKVYMGNNRVAVYTTMISLATKNIISIDTSISDANTFTPIYRSSFTPNHEYIINYGKKEVTGYYLNKKTQKRATINDPINMPLIDENCFDYVLTTIPFALGFKKSFTIYNYSPDNQSNILKVFIEDVNADVYTSKHFGNRDVWRVSMSATTPNGTQHKYLEYIDKNTRRIWKVSEKNDGHNILALNSEDDYNPYHSKFDKEETLKLITTGKSVISGQAFSRDNYPTVNRLSVVNVGKKQVAPAGTVVILIPYTDFFKEWFEQNKKAGQTGQSAPLPKDASECIKSTKVSDNDGHFEFTNLMPGDYLLLTSFVTAHSASRTEVTGQTDTYINGSYQYSTANTTTYNNGVNLTGINVKKIVTIKQDGENVTVKLNQTDR
jgi:hypothetical protein